MVPSFGGFSEDGDCGRISALLSIHAISFAGIAHSRGGQGAAPYQENRRRQV